MTAKRKIMDKNGVQVFPITHTNAVLDDNGNSVEQLLQENLDLINQKQLEVGAVPSDVTPTPDSPNWVTSGGVYNATNIVTEIGFNEYYGYYIDSSTHEKASSSVMRSVEIINDNYSYIRLSAGFTDSSAFAISFFSESFPSPNTFISGVASIGSSQLEEYITSVPQNCELIVCTTRQNFAASGMAAKNMSGVNNTAKNIPVCEDTVKLDDLVLVSSNRNNGNLTKTSEGIHIESIGTGARVGFIFGTLSEGKKYVLEFDLLSDSSNDKLWFYLGSQVTNVEYEKQVFKDSHIKIVFSATSTIDSAWLSTNHIGAGKVADINNIHLSEVMSLTNVANNTRKILHQAVSNKSTFDGIVRKNMAIDKQTHEYLNATNYLTYEIVNDGYSYIRCDIGGNNTTVMAVAFYSSGIITSSNYIGGIVAMNGQNKYDVSIPEGCVLICLSAKLLDIAVDFHLSYTLYGSYTDGRIDYERSNNRLDNIDSIINNHNDSTPVPYQGNEICLTERFRPQNFYVSELSSDIPMDTGQGFAYADGYMFTAQEKGILWIWQYQPSEPNLTFIKKYALQSYAGTNHANSLNFGNRYDVSDQFPLLYISECYGSKGCFVERVTLESSTLIQTITFSASAEYFGNFTNWIPDTKNNKLLAITVGTSAFFVLEFELPDVNTETVILTENDIIRTYTIQPYYTMQGCTICGSKLILPCGAIILFYDMASSTLINTISTIDIMGNAEPEDACVVGSDLMLFGGGNVYRLEFDNTVIPQSIDDRINALERRFEQLENL